MNFYNIIKYNIIFQNVYTTKLSVIFRSVHYNSAINGAFLIYLCYYVKHDINNYLLLGYMHLYNVI